MKRDKEILDLIIKHTEKDIKEFEGLPFTGKNVGILFGRQAECIDALARILKNLVED